MQDIEKPVMVTPVYSNNRWKTGKKPLLVCPERIISIYSIYPRFPKYLMSFEK